MIGEARQNATKLISNRNVTLAAGAIVTAFAVLAAALVCNKFLKIIFEI